MLMLLPVALPACPELQRAALPPVLCSYLHCLAGDGTAVCLRAQGSAPTQLIYDLTRVLRR
jgi:hypothetical protein